MEQNIFEIAAKVSTPWSLAAFAIAGLLYILKRRRKLPEQAGIVILGVVAIGLLPVLAHLYLQSRGIYRVRVVVLDPEHLPVDDAKVTSSMGGEPKRVSGGWEFDIPAAGKPADGKLVVYAAVPQAFLKGQSETLLAGDMSPVTTVPLSKDTSAMVRGRILSSSGEPVSGAHVGLVGYPSETVETSGDGNFILSAHAADNQQVQLYADKVGYEPATKWCPAGDFPNTIVMNRHQGKQ